MTAITDHVPGAGNQPESRTEREYRLALRHSRLVRRLKIALPAAAALLVLAFFSVSFVSTQLPEGVSVASTAIEDGKLVMYNPRLSGEAQNARPYELRAARALQDLTQPNVIELQDIVAELPISDGAVATLDAESGIFNREAQVMRFDKPFSVSTDSGMTAELDNAIINIKAGQLETDQPVRIETPQAVIGADTMRMLDEGKTIVLEENVRMTIDPTAVGRGETNGETE